MANGANRLVRLKHNDSSSGYANIREQRLLLVLNEFETCIFTAIMTICIRESN